MAAKAGRSASARHHTHAGDGVTRTERTDKRLDRNKRSAGASAEKTTSLDRLVHDRVRLGILSALAAVESMSFAEMKSALDVSDGNLSVHARKLEDAGYLVCDKTFVGRTPRTDFRLSPSGRKAFEKYLDHMDALISAARKARP